MKAAPNFHEFSPEEQDKAYAKVRNDRDLAMRMTESFSTRLHMLSEHVCIVDGQLAVSNPKLTKAEIKTLSEVLEVY